MEADDPNPFITKHREDAAKAWKLIDPAAKAWKLIDPAEALRKSS
jgi:hypothetical protein